MADGIESNNSTPEFDEFMNAGEVEVGSELADKKAGGSGKPPREPAAAKPEDKAAAPNPNLEDEEKEGDDEGDGEKEGDDDKSKKKTAKDQQIERLRRERNEARRELRNRTNDDLARRLENIEKGLQGGNRGDNQTAAKAAPDPTDTAKYPLGHLDDRYIEDKLEWLAEQKAGKQAETALQRQQELERIEAATRQQQDILGKVDDLAAKGADLIPNFQEEVVDTGMRGDWDLQQPTFEACHEAENGAQILYDLSQDPKEARRVARLSPFQQLKYVQDRDAELSSGKKPNRKPQAGEPPKNTARGANSKTQINPATDNLDDFEKQWEREAKGQR